MKTVVITGGTAGMGEALAQTFLDRGDTVVIVGRKPPADLPAGERAHVIRADLSLVGEIERVIAEIRAEHPVVDALVFAARHFNSARTETADGIEHTTAVFFLSRALLAEGLRDELGRAERPIILSLSGPGEPGAQVHWDDLALERAYDGGAALEQAGRLADLHAVSFVERHPDAHTRYVLFHPGVVATTFSGSYDEAGTAQIETLKRTARPIAEAIKPILAVLDAPPNAPLSAFAQGRPLPTDVPELDPQDARRADDYARRLLHTAVLRRFVQAINRSDVELLDAAIQPDVVLPPDMPDGLQGREALVAHIREMPDLFESTLTIADEIAEGDKVAARLAIRGRQVGEFQGRAANGQELSIAEHMIAQFRDGRIARIWRVVDIFLLLQQLDGAASVSDPDEALHDETSAGSVSAEEREANRETLRRLLEEVSGSGSYDGLDDFVHEDVVLPGHFPAEFQGRAGLKAALAAYDDVLENRDVVEDTIAEGDKVVARIVARGRLNGEFLGMQGNGQEFTIDEIMIARFRDGKISHIWRVADLFGLQQQIGGAPAQVA